ncbi:MAG: hypothetical protein U1F48_13730 [Burkholderiales bacterium]
MTAQRFLLAALIASLAGCGIGRNDRLDQVRDFRIEWSNPRLADLNYALDTCRVWGDERAYATHCAKRNEEARAIVNGLATCQDRANANYPACQHLGDWLAQHASGVEELLRNASPQGHAADLSELPNLYLPSNPLISATWSNADRALVMANGAWAPLAFTVLALAAVTAAGLRRRVRSRSEADCRDAGASIGVLEPTAPTNIALEAAAQSDEPRTTLITEPRDRVSLSEPPGDQRDHRMAEPVMVCHVDGAAQFANETNPNTDAQSSAYIEHASKERREAEQLAKRRLASEQARRDFDKFKDLF